jgi:hypothetical protein
MKKVIISIVLLGVLLLIVLLWLKHDDNKVISELEKSVKEKKEVVSFENTSGGFDSLMIVDAYSYPELIKQRLNVDITGTGIDTRDDVILVVFLKERKVKNIVYLDRSYYRTDIDMYKIFPKSYLFKMKMIHGAACISE